jgi:hypothetical protein
VHERGEEARGGRVTPGEEQGFRSKGIIPPFENRKVLSSSTKTIHPRAFALGRRASAAPRTPLVVDRTTHLSLFPSIPPRAVSNVCPPEAKKN